MTTKKKQKPSRATLLNLAIAAMEADECLGYCKACGAEASEVEPDAREYKCEECGECQVYGAEELVLMLS